MTLADFRNKIVSFIVPIVLVGTILGGIIWLVGTTYFWDTSKVTLTLPTDDTVRVSLTIQTRVLYRDFSIFGFPYSLHFVLPWSETQTCSKTCVFERIPAGDAVISISGKEDKRMLLSVSPDTEGVLDIRPDITLVPVPESTLPPDQRNHLSDTEVATFSDVTFTNTVENIYLVDIDGESRLYDGRTKQVLLLPTTLQVEKIGRGEKEGMYLLYAAKEGMFSYDRYGRQSLEHIASIVRTPWTFTWNGDTTTVSSSNGINTISGIWWPLADGSLTDGHSVSQIRGR